MPRSITRESMRVNPLCLCIRVIVNEKLLNLVKTTSSVLLVLLLIYHNNYNTSDLFIDFLLIINLYFFDKQRSLVVKFWTTIKVLAKKKIRQKCEILRKIFFCILHFFEKINFAKGSEKDAKFCENKSKYATICKLIIPQITFSPNVFLFIKARIGGLA